MSLNQIPINSIKGIGKSTIEKLNTNNIYTIHDLLENFPNKYESYEITNLEQAKHDEKITIIGKIITAPVNNFYQKNRSRMQFSIMVDNNLVIKVMLFNRAFLKNKLTIDSDITVTGKWNQNTKTIVASTIKFGIHDNRNIIPSYKINTDIKLQTFQKNIETALIQYEPQINDVLPVSLTQKYRLISYKDALRFAHFPQNMEQLKQAKRRVKYEELLKFQLKIQTLRQKIKYDKLGFAKIIDPENVQKFIQKLPFELTSEQEKVLKEISDDLVDSARMNRLLQGDVGSGKTVVAAISLLIVMQSGYQTALMVPTEILAKQHLESLTTMFTEFSEFKVEFLSSSIKGKKRKEILSELKEGKIHLLVGTHSLIQDEVEFQNLGLAVVDEQHRFGVEQRKKLRQKGESIDMLMMTATPIPRTLAISAFGDMDISSIKELPKGRKKITTYLTNDSKMQEVQTFISSKIINKGQQAYIITPLIEESEMLDAKNATEIHETWKQHWKEQATVGLMHGKLTQQEKDDIMQKFANGEIQILISTTVIEVGVNVPNANLILIYDANRFGLSQLHQLRGRVGRGTDEAYCFLLSNSKNKETLERLNVITNSTNGFEIAEADLKIRGPGDFFGAKQSGIPTFKMANLIEDYKILDIARQDAYDIMRDDEFQHNNNYLALRDYIKETIANEHHQFD